MVQFELTEAIATALSESQRDNLCAICGLPSITLPPSLVPLCRKHLMSLDLYGLDRNSA
jgi:hypothetical protein